METVELIQGSPEWHAHRAAHWNASDAPAMLGCSKYKSRSQLIRELATGETAEVDAATQKRFDDGHRFEALARLIAEKIIGLKLFPLVGVSGRLSASFDGLTMDELIGYEHKSLNNDLRAALPHDGRNSHEHNNASDLPAMYRVQMEQQLMVSGADKILFVATCFDENDNLLEERHCWYYPDMALREEIAASWSVLQGEVDNYQHVEVIPAAVAAPIKELPALDIQISGSVVASNFVVWRDIVVERIAAINTELNEDQDFADAAKMVTFLDEGEKRIDLVKAQAQSQASSIDEVFRALDAIKAEMRAKRLELDKLVAARKESIRAEIMKDGKTKLDKHIASLNAKLGNVQLPTIHADIMGAMKNKRTVDTLRESVATCVAAAIVEANQKFEGIKYNLTTYEEIGGEFPSLFPDLANLVLKAKDDFTSTVKLRIAEHKEAERVKAEKAAAEAAAQPVAASPAAEVQTETPAPLPQNVAPLRPAGGGGIGRAMTDDELRTAIGNYVAQMDRPQLNQVLMYCKDKIAA